MNRRKSIILMIVFITLITSSCRTSRISQTQMELVQLALKEDDLPGKWDRKEKGWGAGYGGESYGVSYTRGQFVFINHTVSLHSSEERAKQAYTEWEAEWYAIADFESITSFSPSNLNDDYRFGCEKKEPDDPIPYLRVCIYLQRHGTIINFVKIHFDNRSTENPTFDEIDDILAILDERLNKILPITTETE